MLEWIARRYEQMKRTAPLINMGLQSLTLASVLFGLMSWRGVGYWFVPLIVGSILTITAFLSWLYYVPLNMRRHERLAQMELNPTEAEILFSPKEAYAWEQIALLLAGKITLDDYLERINAHVLKRGNRTPKQGAKP